MLYLETTFYLCRENFTMHAIILYVFVLSDLYTLHSLSTPRIYTSQFSLSYTQARSLHAV